MAVNGMARILDWTRLRLWRLLVRTGLAGEVHYINGPETLPAPLTPEEEAEVVTEEEIRTMLAEGREQGTIRPEESQMIQNVFEFDDTPAEQAGTHRKDVVFLHMEDEDAVWDQTILESRFTYFPVCRENRDNVIGILDTRDYFRLKDRSRESLMEHAVDRPFLVPETMRAHSLLSAMKKGAEVFRRASGRIRQRHRHRDPSRPGGGAGGRPGNRGRRGTA